MFKSTPVWTPKFRGRGSTTKSRGEAVLQGMVLRRRLLPLHRGRRLRGRNRHPGGVRNLRGKISISCSTIEYPPYVKLNSFAYVSLFLVSTVPSDTTNQV